MAWKMVEYLCPEHGRYESLENTSASPVMDFGPTWDPCPECGVHGQPVVSAPTVKIYSGFGSVSIPKASSRQSDRWDEYERSKKENGGVLDTRHLAKRAGVL